MQRNKGITLVALVITIILLLILAGITINLTLGEHGILNMAKEAGKNYQNAAEYEQQAIGDFFNEAQNIIAGGNGNGNNAEATQIALDKNSITMYVGGTYTFTITVTPSTANPNIIWSSSNNNIATVENGVVTAKAQGNVIITATIRENVSVSCSIVVKNPVALSDLTAGKWIYYDTGVTSVGDNGIIKCVVLYPTTSSYGLQIMASEPIEEIPLGSANLEIATQEYDNAIITLNNAAMKYKNSNYALDARSIGTDPSNKNADSTSPASIRNSSGTVVSMDYKEKTEYYKKDAEAVKNVPGPYGGIYWVASRYGFPDDSNYRYHSPGIFIGQSDNLDGKRATFMNVDADTKTFMDAGGVTRCGLIPVITLKTTIKIVGGEGSYADPYTLGIK